MCDVTGVPSLIGWSENKWSCDFFISLIFTSANQGEHTCDIIQLIFTAANQRQHTCHMTIPEFHSKACQLIRYLASFQIKNGQISDSSQIRNHQEEIWTPLTLLEGMIFSWMASALEYISLSDMQGSKNSENLWLENSDKASICPVKTANALTASTLTQLLQKHSTG